MALPEEAAPDPEVRKGGEVSAMFASIAPTYDLLNHLLSLNADRIWRRAAARALAPREGQRVLDLCAGTGDLAIALAALGGVRVVGADFCLPMLKIAKKKFGRLKIPPALAGGDAMALPFKDSVYDAATVAFGVRNFEDLRSGLREIKRVLKPGGRLAVLEFGEPGGPFLKRFYGLYFHRVLPALGRLVSGKRGAYAYLPATVNAFPPPKEFAAEMEGAGFAVVSQSPLTLGIAWLHLAVKRADEG